MIEKQKHWVLFLFCFFGGRRAEPAHLCPHPLSRRARGWLAKSLIVTSLIRVPGYILNSNSRPSFFKSYFWSENVLILTLIWLKYVPRVYEWVSNPGSYRQGSKKLRPSRPPVGGRCWQYERPIFYFFLPHLASQLFFGWSYVPKILESNCIFKCKV